jgi:hypothetical protein
MHDEFELFGFAWHDMETQDTGWVGPDELEKFLRSRMYEKRMVAAHNAQFDLSIIAYRYGMLPGAAACTVQMAYAILGNRLAAFNLDAVAEALGLGSKIKGVLARIKGKHGDAISALDWLRMLIYAKQDVKLCAAVFSRLRVGMNADNFTDMDWHIRQALDPVLRTDRELLQDALDEIVQAQESELAHFGVTPTDLRRSESFAALLREYGAEPPTVISETTGKRRYAFNKQNREFMALVEQHPNTEVRRLCQLRLDVQSTAKTGKLKRYIEVHDAMGGKKPILVNYCGAVQTKRPSGRSKLNDLNMPRKSKLREAVVAAPGHVIVAGDLTGAELRIARTGTNDFPAMQVIEAGGDLYVDFIASVLDKPVEDVTDDERFVGKVAQLSLQYATGADKLRHTVWSWARIDLTAEEARQIVQFFRRVRHTAVARYWRYLERAVLPHMASKSKTPLPVDGFPIEVWDGKIWLPSGLCIEYPGLALDKNKTGHTAGGGSALRHTADLSWKIFARH